MSSPTVDVGPTFGAAFIGLLVSAVLFGVTLMQTYEYYRRYRQDSTYLKSMVATLTVLDTLHLILCSRTIYWYLVSNFTNVENLDLTTWSMALQTDCNGIIGMVVEFFFARRVWIMGRNRLLTALIVVLAFIHFALGVVFTAESFILGRFSKFKSLTWITCAGLGSAAAADILIAISMCYYLSKKRTGIERTDSLVTTLMLYSINTGLLTSILATAAVILFATLPVTFEWLCFFWIMGKCYVNSLLASLNSRESLRSKVYTSAVNMSRTRSVRPDAFKFRAEPILLQKPQTALAVSVETTTEYRTDFPIDSPPSPSEAHGNTVDWPSETSSSQKAPASV